MCGGAGLGVLHDFFEGDLLALGREGIVGGEEQHAQGQFQ
jgi:hypothetical protein